MSVVSVSALNNQIKALLESTFVYAHVTGELSRVTYHNSGHIYFSLKDSTSTLKCVMFRGNANTLKFRLEEGLKVVLHGAITLYTPRGEYQLNCVSAEPEGSGALALAYEQLKKKLQNQGYFEPSIKKPLPTFVRKVVLVTSATGAALADMKHVANKRWPMVELVLLDTLVQGEMAKDQIAQNIAYADTLNPDVIVIARGGGSVEDLWAFNEEVVANAIYRCSTPLVSAIGHEIDYVISDFVSDMRAPTPSAAMELILPDQLEWKMSLDNMHERLSQNFKHILHKKSTQLSHIDAQFENYSIESKLDFYAKEIHLLEKRFDEKTAFIIQNHEHHILRLHQNLQATHANTLNKKTNQLFALQENFSANEPKKRVKKGFVQLSQKGKLTELSTVKKDDTITLVDAQYKVTSLVKEKVKLV